MMGIKFSTSKFLRFFAAFLFCFSSLSAFAAPESPAELTQRRTRNPAFALPRDLAPRVQFWLNVFTKYGKNQVVIHHREFPQVTFGVLDFSREAAELNPVALEKFKKARVDEVTRQVVNVVKLLYSGVSTETDFGRRVETALRAVPGRDRLKNIVENPDLIRSQTGIREKCAEALERSGKYLPQIERIFVREFGLPVELTRLPFIESSFDYRAYSSVGAAGIWQLMPRTGRQYLTVNRFIDERRDPITASYAAARYLQSAYEGLGSWPLAVTAYNHGNAGVARKVRDYGTTDIVRLIERAGEKPFGFASSNFYPEFLAALEVFDSPGTYFPEVRIAQPVDVSRVALPAAMSIGSVSRKLGVSVSSLQDVNFALADTIWAGRFPVPRGYEMRVPRNVPVTMAKIDEPEISTPPTPHPVSSTYASAFHRVRKGDTLASVSKRYGIPVAKLQALNELSGDTLRIGQQLVLAESGIRRGQEPKPGVAAPRTISYTVKSGDSLHSIAAKYGVSVGQIREMNRMTSTKIKVGQELKIEPKRNAGTGGLKR